MGVENKGRKKIIGLLDSVKKGIIYQLVTRDKYSNISGVGIPNNR